MADPIFVSQDGAINDDGRKLMQWLDANLEVMESADATALNTYPGPLQYLFTRRKLNQVTTEQFVKDYGKTYALNAYRIMRVLEEQQQQAQTVEETAQQTSELVKQLEALQALVKTQGEELAALKEAKKPGRKPKAQAEEEEAEEESE